MPGPNLSRLQLVLGSYGDKHRFEGGAGVAVARVTEISSTSPKSFEDAIQQGIARATKTLRGVRGPWIKEQRLDIRDNAITEYQVNLLVTFVLED